MDESNPSTHKYNSKNVLSFAQLGEIDFPRREWLWDEWLPLGTASLLGGPPGAGKSLLAQTLCMAASAGLLLFGKQTKLTSTLYLTCEDEKAELRRRAISIPTSFGKSVTDFEDGYLISKVGQNATICDQKFAKTSNYRELDELMGDLKLQLVALDLIPDLWMGNEIIRQEVNKFVKGFLGSLAVKHNACIVALHHPSVSGQASGEGRSGSTAWEGSVRSRLYLSGADSAGVRKLSLKKSNYSALTEINLKWDQGALQLSEQSHSDSTLKDGVRQALKGVGKELRDALRANNGEMTHAEVKAVLPKSDQRRDAIEALGKRVKRHARAHGGVKWKLETPSIDSTLSTNGNTHHLRQGNISDVSMPSIMVCQERNKVTKRQKLVMSERVVMFTNLSGFTYRSSGRCVCLYRYP